jgi:cytochrome c oxidase assembly protein subunit 16
MTAFPRNKLPNARSQALQRAVRKRPFLLFGLPFIGIVVAGSFFLTPVTANRYDSFDKKRRWVEKQDAFGKTGLQRRKFDAREEYYVSLAGAACAG